MNAVLLLGNTVVIGILLIGMVLAIAVARRHYLS
jgi:hypothetical protein